MTFLIESIIQYICISITAEIKHSAIRSVQSWPVDLSELLA